VRSPLPLTPGGLLLLATAAALLSLGAVRVDLAALFWGSGFFLVAVYCLAAGGLYRLALRRRRDAASGFLSVVLPPAGLWPGDEAEAFFSVRLPRAIPPGFLVRLTLPLRWHERRIDTVVARLAAGPNERAIRFTVGERGVFRSSEAVLEIRDALGFTLNRLPVALQESMTVFPPLAERGEIMRQMEEGEETAELTRSRRRSEELLEVRKYYPGDDVRRLNWKVFAHSNELFLRVGENTPPPESRILFVLDCTANPLVPQPLASRYLDGLVDACASAAAALLDRRVDILFCGPVGKGCRAYTAESRTELLAAFADAWWVEEGWMPELPGRPRLHAAVFSSPGSPGLERILTEARIRGWGMSLFLKGLPPAEERARRSVRDLLLLSAAGRKSGKTIAREREAAAFAEAMARDLALYRGAPWKVSHALAI